MKNCSLGTKLIGVGILFIIIPLLVIGGISLYWSSNSMKKIEERQLKTIRMLLSDQLDLQLNMQKTLLSNAPSYEISLKSILRALSLDVALKDVSQVHLTMNPTRFHNQRNYELFFLADQNGDIVEDRHGSNFAGQNISRERYFKEAMLGITYIGDALLSAKTNKNYVIISSPLKQKDSILGVMVIGWKLDFLNQILKKPDLGNGGYVFIADQKGRVIAHSHQQSKINTQLKDERGMISLIDKLSISEKGIAEFTNDSGVQIIAFGQIKSTGWSLGIVVPKSEILAPMYTIRNILGFSILTIGVIISFITFWIVQKNINLPIRNLIHTFETIAAGDFSKPIDTSRNDEIGSLAKSFKIMRDVIKVKISDFERLIKILESTSDMVAMALPDGQIIYMNVSGRKMVGWQKVGETIEKQTFLDIIPAWISSEISERNMPKAIQNGIWEGESIITKSNQDQFPISQVIMSHKNVEGKIEYYSTIVRDISIQKENEQRLTDTLQINKKIISESPIGITIYSSNGQCIEANQAILNIIGTSREQILNTNYNFVDYWKTTGILATALQAIKENVTMRHELVEHEFNGKILFLDCFFVPFQSGGESQLMVLNIDISQRIKDEKKIWHLRNYLKNIIDSMPSVLIGIDSDFNITEWNIEAQNSTGVEPSDAWGKKLTEAFPRLKSEMSKIQQAISNTETQKSENVLWQKDGKIFYSDILIYPLVANGSAGAVIRIDDVTERTLLKEMMIQNEKMISMGQITAGVAHEINNPLGAIIMNAQNIIRRLSPTLKKNVQEADKYNINLEELQEYLNARKVLIFLKGIQESGKRASDIIKDMLHFSRKSESKKSLIHLPEIMDRAIKLEEKDYDLKKEYDFKHIKIIKEYDLKMGPVLIIETEFEQVLINLLKNAVQAMLETGKKDEMQITLRTIDDGDMARIEVEDNGPGMDLTTQKKIFEPFFTTKPSGKGTGLGLSVSYMIVTNKHAGTMKVESYLGKGTKFVICLPFDGTV